MLGVCCTAWSRGSARGKGYFVMTNDNMGELAFSPSSGALGERWPKDENGEYVPPVFLMRCGSVDMEDIMAIGLLEAYEIPVLKEYPNNGALGKIILGMSGSGVEIFVPETMYMTAKAILEAEPDDELPEQI